MSKNATDFATWPRTRQAKVSDNRAAPTGHTDLYPNQSNKPAWAYHTQLGPGQLTPMLRHYVELKAADPERVLLYQLGNIFKCFFRDGIELFLVLTPGTVLEEGMLNARHNNWLETVVEQAQITQPLRWGLTSAVRWLTEKRSYPQASETNTPEPRRMDDPVRSNRPSSEPLMATNEELSHKEQPLTLLMPEENIERAWLRVSLHHYVKTRGDSIPMDSSQTLITIEGVCCRA